VDAGAAIDVRGLRIVRGGRVVLPGIDVRAGRGRITGLVGPSGSGKSTLMRAIVGVQIVEAGTVTVLGLPAGTRALRERVAYVTQSGSVYRDLSVFDNVAYAARILRLGRDAVEHAIATVDLADVVAQRVDRLSGGQQHRVSLACALLGAPELLVLDEPTVGLDPLLRRELWSLFGRLRDDGATLLVSTHVLDEAAHCDDVLLLRDGRVLAAQTPGGLRSRTGTDDLDEAFVRLIEEAERSR
jgi:ABC-2 type transport system ATP-binding protein